MSAVISTITKAAAVRTFGTASMRERIEYAFGTSADRQTERVALATVWQGLGYSVRGAVAGVTVAFAGNVPDGFSKSSLGRAYLVAGIVNPPAGEDGISAQPLAHIEDEGQWAEAVAGLVAVSKHGKAATETALTAYLAARTHVAGIKALTKAATDSKAVTAALTGATARPVAGEAADGGKAVETTETTEPDETPVTGTNGTAPLMGFTTARLITELGRRVETGTFSPADFEQFELLAAFVAEYEASRESIPTE